jgi:hypothetical protein
MKFCLSKTARKDLGRTLTWAGARSGVDKAVTEIEVLVTNYHASSIEKGRIPEKLFRGEAMRIWRYADLLCNLADDLGPRTRKRMERELDDREEVMSLDEYFQSVNDICLFALHAAGDGERPLSARFRRVDEGLLELTSDVASVYRKFTNSELPKAWTTGTPYEWRAMREVQCHPLWIVYDQLGIYLDAYHINDLIENLRVKGPEIKRPV